MRVFHIYRAQRTDLLLVSVLFVVRRHPVSLFQNTQVNLDFKKHNFLLEFNNSKGFRNRKFQKILFQTHLLLTLAFSDL